MKKYRVIGVVEVMVTKDVWAYSESEAYEKASMELDTLESYLGNGGDDKLIGVEGRYESVDTCGNTINYNDIEELEDNPDYIECPECAEELDKMTTKDGTEYWWCINCEQAYDEYGNEIWIDEEEEDE